MEERELVEEILKDSKLVDHETWPGYAHCQYKLVYQPVPAREKELTARHGALIADDFNLCFGGRGFSKTIVGDKLIFTGIYHTD
jgi:hypothetical protein